MATVMRKLMSGLAPAKPQATAPAAEQPLEYESGMIIPNIWRKQNMFQTSNQLYITYVDMYIYCMYIHNDIICSI